MILDQVGLLKNLRLPCKLACPVLMGLCVLVLGVWVCPTWVGWWASEVCTVAAAVSRDSDRGPEGRLLVGQKSCKDYKMVQSLLWPVRLHLEQNWFTLLSQNQALGVSKNLQPAPPLVFLASSSILPLCCVVSSSAQALLHGMKNNILVLLDLLVDFFS